jgi:hypothetical protein
MLDFQHKSAIIEGPHQSIARHFDVAIHIPYTTRARFVGCALVWQPVQLDKAGFVLSGVAMKKGSFGPRNGFWRGGRSVASNGYVLIRVGTDHHLADVRGYAYEHRLVAEQKIGRRLLSGEQVHHIDGDKQNNRPDNLEVMASPAHHFVEHRTAGKPLRMPDEPNPVIACACGCGAQLARYDGSGRCRKYISGHNPMPSPTVDAICMVLRQGPLPRAVIADRCGINLRAIACALSKMKKRGIVRQVHHGVWSL